MKFGHFFTAVAVAGSGKKTTDHIKRRLNIEHIVAIYPSIAVLMVVTDHRPIARCKIEKLRFDMASGADGQKPI